MTHYVVDIYSSTIAGRANSLESNLVAMRVVDKYCPSGEVKNAGWCSACKTSSYPESGTGLFHSFMIRERPAYEIVRDSKFTWTKKKGIGRRSQLEYLTEISEAGIETWFQLEIQEL